MSNFYHDTPSEFTIGQRVELHPATVRWMMGDRYGEVIGHEKREPHRVVVLTDRGSVQYLAPSMLAIVE